MSLMSGQKKQLAVFFLATAFALIFFFASVNADPVGPGELNVLANETAAAPGAIALNISGGRIATINLTSNTQNPRWKAFVGNVTGSFTLDDAAGSTIYDWTLTTISGEIYATRNSSSITWSDVNCSNVTFLVAEDTAMGHGSSPDNITATFSGTTHAEFFVGGVNITENSCPTINTYVNSVSQDSSFEEIALYESSGGNTIYATIMEQDVTGFDGQTYDFQMIVPERGEQGNTISTVYYMYVELT